MIIFVAVDDKNGMTFNKRRQSKDKILREHIMEQSKEHTLWMNTYTKNQFETPLAENIIVDDDFLDKAGKDDYCFVENLFLERYEDKIEKVILFKWNRVYPADTHFDIDLEQNGWKLVSVEEFAGNSHEKITKEEWTNEKKA